MIKVTAIILYVNIMLAQPYGPYAVQSNETVAQACERVRSSLGIREFQAGADMKVIGPSDVTSVVYPDGSKFAFGQKVTEIYGHYYEGWHTFCLPDPASSK